MFDNFVAFCLSHEKVANLLSYTLLELKELSGKKEKFLFYQISYKPTLKNLFQINLLLMMEKWKQISCYLQVFVNNSIGSVVGKES